MIEAWAIWYSLGVILELVAFVVFYRWCSARIDAVQKKWEERLYRVGVRLLQEQREQSRREVERQKLQEILDKDREHL